jgi:hypothetical protein
MKRWRIWAILALFLCVPILLGHSTNTALLQDSDTAVLLKAVRARHAPLSWFTGDWPLANHFYRPLPTLTFELDNALYGNNPAGYGWTNAILCALCVLALFWFLSEVFRSPPWALAGSALFVIWTFDKGFLLTAPVNWALIPLVVVGLYRHGFKFWRYLPACLVLSFFATELSAPEVNARSLQFFMINWLPGRTASVMTLFALMALAAYVRYERARNVQVPTRAPTALDRPLSTRSGVESTPGHAGWWLCVTVGALALALASYEQAVMLPGVLFGVAVLLRLKGRRPNWAVHAIFFLLLLGYLALRHAVIPSGVSSYQAQQFRHGPGVIQDLLDYAIPNVMLLPGLYVGLVESAYVLLNTSSIAAIAGVICTATTFVQARRNWQIVLAGWSLSLVAFFPMAWLKPFGHYHYWPMALRTILVLGVAKVAWELISIAACPPALQAPPRPSPAPGSLPRP